MANPGLLDYIALAVILMEPMFWLGYWPRCVRAIRARVPGARARIYREMATVLWIATLYVLAVWITKGRPWDTLRLGLSGPLRSGIGFSVAAIVVALLVPQARKARKALQRPEAAARLREQLVFADPLVPETDGERRGFWFLSLTAGICEEILFRGFLIWLITAWLGVVSAVILSSIVFGCAHIYLGFAQVPRTAIVGLVLALIVVAAGSLWPAIVIHAALDLSSGEIGFRARRAAAASLGAVAPITSCDC